MPALREETVLLDQLEEGLSGLRRVWAHPDRKHRFLAALGVPVELSVLRTLRAIELGVDAYADADTVSVSDVADLLQVTASTASRLLDRAVQHGYVTRAACDGDRRRTILQLTDEGAVLLARARQVRRSLLAEITAEWSADDIADLNRLLHRLQDDMQRITN